jgi:hypothetical protein
VGVTCRDEFREVYGVDFHGMDLSWALTDPFESSAVLRGLLTMPERTVASCWTWAWSADA